MSSERSVSTSSSGVRQFGLYRTIDARTEEFLRLSRKRQIRQGCACAAISTAITVTVVIAIILIYEYSVVEPSSKASLKPNWLHLMNKSAKPFNTKLSKAKINLDSMYLTLHPLLKTLKYNKYYDESIDDRTTLSPLYVNGYKPEEVYTKNILSDSRTFVPSSRLFTIEYKTSPVIYFKHLTRNLDHFARLRKIRNYQRIMSYVEKMINHKGAFTTTVPMFKSAYRFYKKPSLITYTNTASISKGVDHVSKKLTESNKLKLLKKKSTTNKKSFNCHCPRKIYLLLSKLIISLQNLTTNFFGNGQILCNDVILNTNKSFVQEVNHTSSESKFNETMKIYQSSEIVNIVAANKQHIINTSMTTTTKQYIKGMNEKYLQESTTKPIPKTSRYFKIKKILFPTRRNFIRQKDEIFDRRMSWNSLPIIRDTKINYSSPGNEFKISDIQITDLISGNFEQPHEHEEISTVFSSLTKDEADLGAFKIHSSNNTNYTVNEKKEYNSMVFQNVSHESSQKPNQNNSIGVATEKRSIVLSSGFNFLPQSTELYLSNIRPDHQIMSKDATLEEVTDDFDSEEIISEDNLKNLKRILNKIKVSETFNRSVKKEPLKLRTEIDLYDVTKIEKHTDVNSKNPNSMMPEERRNFLEIQTNYFSRDGESHDFDNTMDVFE